MYTKYARKMKLSSKQEDILCTIQKATYEKDNSFLSCLPEEVVKIAKQAQKFWSLKMEDKGEAKDDELCELVKKYWDRKGISISR